MTTKRQLEVASTCGSNAWQDHTIIRAVHEAAIAIPVEKLCSQMCVKLNVLLRPLSGVNSEEQLATLKSPLCPCVLVQLLKEGRV